MASVAFFVRILSYVAFLPYLALWIIITIIIVFH